MRTTHAVAHTTAPCSCGTGLHVGGPSLWVGGWVGGWSTAPSPSTLPNGGSDSLGLDLEPKERSAHACMPAFVHNHSNHLHQLAPALYRPGGARGHPGHSRSAAQNTPRAIMPTHHGSQLLPWTGTGRGASESDALCRACTGAIHMPFVEDAVDSELRAGRWQA